MILIQILVLALIQGLTEFLPVSSSAHLIIGGRVFDWPDQGLVFDVATHLGTLMAAVLYFREDIRRMIISWLVPAQAGKDGGAQARELGLSLLVASVPAVLVGGLLYQWIESTMRDVRVIAFATIGFGLLLWWADHFFSRSKTMAAMTIKSGLIIGLVQVLALVPGTSRSGITITIGRMLGFDVDTAARFSFLLSVPVIAAAGSFGMLRIMLHDAPINWSQFGLAVAFSALAGWLCIAAFLSLLRRVGLLPFILYRLVLGVVLFWLVI